MAPIGATCSITEERVNTQKELRIIETLEPVMTSHRLVVNRKVIEEDYRSTEGRPAEQRNVYRLFYQMSRITRDKGSLVHDDRLDAVTKGVSRWMEHMAADQRKLIEQARDKELEAELRRFMDGTLNVLGHSPQPTESTWVDHPRGNWAM